jgi:pyruvate, orthophosphate dikinase
LRAYARGDYPRLDRHTEAEVRSAMASGHSDVVSASPLLTMLAAIRLSGVS